MTATILDIVKEKLAGRHIVIRHERALSCEIL